MAYGDIEKRIQVIRHSDEATDAEYGGVFQHNQRMMILVVGNEFFDAETGRLDTHGVTVRERIVDAVLDNFREHPQRPLPSERQLLVQAVDLLNATKNPAVEVDEGKLGRFLLDAERVLP